MNSDSQSGPISTLSALNDWDAMILEKQYFSSGATCNTFKVLYDEHLVFLKRLKPELAINPSYVNLFQKEYEVGSHLHSEYFPRYIDYTDEGGCPIIMMEYVDGMTLEQLLDENPGYFRSKQNLNRFVRQMLHLPTTLKQIPRGCFVDDAIKSLFIPEGVERICQDAFVGNNHLVDAHFKGGTLYVPSSSLDAYRQAQGYEKLDIKAIR